MISFFLLTYRVWAYDQVFPSFSLFMFIVYSFFCLISQLQAWVNCQRSLLVTTTKATKLAAKRAQKPVFHFIFSLFRWCCCSFFFLYFMIRYMHFSNSILEGVFKGFSCSVFIKFFIENEITLHVTHWNLKQKTTESNRERERVIFLYFFLSHAKKKFRKKNCSRMPPVYFWFLGSCLVI